MGRRKLPASLKTGDTENKKQLKERHEMELTLKGSNDLVYSTPTHLDPLAKVYYEFLVDELKPTEILANLDIPLLEQTADCLSKIRQCEQMIDKLGLFYEEQDRYGHTKVVENVAVKTKMNLLTKYVQFSNLLGLSPSARAEIASKKIEAQQNQEDPLLKILNGC